MSKGSVSAPVLETSTGWFRYNYEQERLEFIRNDNKMIGQFWPIPADQWDALPSKQAYCEQIFTQEQRNMVSSNQKRKMALFAWAPFVIVSFLTPVFPIPGFLYIICIIIGFAVSLLSVR